MAPANDAILAAIRRHVAAYDRPAAGNHRYPLALPLKLPLHRLSELTRYQQSVKWAT